MRICRREIGFGVVVGVGVAAFAAACRGNIPTRPDELREGTFAFVLHGTVGRHSVALDEVVSGTACRANNYILLDSRTGSSRLSVNFPAISATPAKYPIASRQTQG